MNEGWSIRGEKERGEMERREKVRGVKGRGGTGHGYQVMTDEGFQVKGVWSIRKIKNPNDYSYGINKLSIYKIIVF